MEERYIASVDLGTSKIALTIAKVSGDAVQVVYYKESPSEGIRYSYVFNPKKVENMLKKVVREAENDLGITIQQAIVGLPRYYVRQETASAGIDRSEYEDEQIEENEVKDLKTKALESYPLEDLKKDVIYGAVAQSFSTEESFNELESDIVGMTGAKLEGNFKVFIGNRRHSINIDNVFNNLGITIAKKYFTPGITAKAVLRKEQMENGVALIDLGAGVSSVTIFKGNIMRFYAAIPFGGNSITNDIKSECNITFDLADNIKMAYGACMPNKLSTIGDKIIHIVDGNGIEVSVKYISEIVSARMKEIIDALLYEIQESGYSKEEDLKSGVVITGGGANLLNCANYIKEESGYSVKVGFPRHFFSCEGCPEAKGSSAATSMGMIMAAKADRSLNCIDEPPMPKWWEQIIEEEKNRKEKAPASVAAPVAEPDFYDSKYDEIKASEAKKNESMSIEPTIAAAQEDVPEEEEEVVEMVEVEESEEDRTVFSRPTKEEEADAKQRKREEDLKKKEEKRRKKIEEDKQRQEKKKRDREQSVLWKVFSRVEEKLGSIYDEMNEEEA